MSEGTQTLQPLGYNAGKSLLSREFRDEEDVLWSAHLVGAVGTTYRVGGRRGERESVGERRGGRGGVGGKESTFLTTCTHAYTERGEEGEATCMSWLTKLLNGFVSAPWQLKSDMDTTLMVL